MSQGPRDRWDPSALPFAFFHTSKRGICQARLKSQDNCEQLSCKTARPDKIGTHPGWGSGPLFSAPPGGAIDAVSERVWSEGRAADELPRPFR
jgi:hypothetical protein